MAKKVVNKTPAKKSSSRAPKNYSLLKSIRREKVFKNNVVTRDVKVRKWVDENVKTRTKGTIVPGQLIMFNYFEPALKEELEYYDAMPCTIFFNTFRTQSGELRVLGFNLHYYPPKMRFIILDRIFSIFQPLYEKSWDQPLKAGLTFIQYKMLMEQLNDQGLGFGTREYIPTLMHKIKPIPPKDWQKAVLTEGRFKKRTREQIMKYWRQWIDKNI